MAFIGWLILGLIGGVAGMYAAYRTTPQRATEWIAAAVVGVIGGLLGGWVLSLIGIEAAGWLASIVVAFLGSWAILTAFRSTRRDPTGVETRQGARDERSTAGTEHDRERDRDREMTTSGR